MEKYNYTEMQVDRISKFLQDYMRRNQIESLTADECAELLAKDNVLTNTLGPKPGFNFRQLPRNGRDGKIKAIDGVYQKRPHTRWMIMRIK